MPAARKHELGQVLLGAQAGIAEGDLVRVLAAVVDEFLEILGGEFIVRDHHERQVDQYRDLLEVFQRLVAQLVDVGIDGHGAAGGQRQRVAVRLGARDELSAQHAARARLGLDDGRLAQFSL
jgi:hypothetical protein